MASKIELNLFDRIAIAINPVKGKQRLLARHQIGMASKMGNAYNGASKRRNATKNWLTTQGDADSDLLPDLPELRARSRDLVRNNPLAAGAINTKVTSIVGTGLRVQSQIDADYLNLTPEQAQEWQRNAEREFRFFSESSECDIERHCSFNQLQDLVLRSCFENGDVFASLPYVERDGFPWGTKIQIIEADRVCNKDEKPDTDTLSGGVQKDIWGAPEKYHVLKKHPGSYIGNIKKEWEELDAYGEGRRNVLHVYKKLRAGQTRAAPDLTPVIEAFKQLGQYTEGELMAAVISGMFTVFIETENGEGIGGEAGATAPSKKQEELELGYGSVVDLAAGEKVTTSNPGRPNTAFDPFVLAILRQIGVALELPYEILIKHFTASYSASRAALLEAWRMYKARRVWFAETFCQPVYETVITESVMMGRLYAPGFLEDYTVRKAYLRSIWVGDAPGQLDPLKETRASLERVEGLISTRSKESIELTGDDWDQTITQLGHEQRRIKDAGLAPEVQAETTPIQNIERKQQEEEDSDAEQ